MKIEVVTDACPAGWAGCEWTYTRGHYCIRTEGHKGAHRCDCGATTTRKDALESAHPGIGEGT